MRIALTYNERRGSSELEAEFDTRAAIESVAALVRSLGHAVTLVDVTGSVARLATRLMRLAPDLVLNFAEGEHGPFREAFYAALFDQLGLRHTGSTASALAICLDKALAKRVVAAAGVRVPHGVLVRDPAELDAGAPLPAIVKPNFEGSSKGLGIARDRDELASIVAATLARYPAGVLVEEYVAGIDVAVGWVAGLGLLPAIHYKYRARGAFAIYDYALKHERPELVEIAIPAELPPGTGPRLEQAATRAVAALGVTGYGRVDVRVTPDGEVVFLEMNPLPSLTPVLGHDELYVAAARRGTTSRELLAAILAA
jgi:D-alanine-D-alanine ligase